MQSLIQNVHREAQDGNGADQGRHRTRLEADGPVGSDPGSSGRFNVVLLDDFEVVAKGLSATLSTCAQFELIEQGSMRGPGHRADIILLDPFVRDRTEVNLRRILGDNWRGKLVLYSWIVDSAQLAVARAAGLWGYLWKGLDSAELLDAFHRILLDERVYSASDAAADDLGGLSQREMDVVKLILQGCSNDEIARLLFLSPNSIKGYIRLAYRKMGVRSRSEAILWGLSRGLGPQGIRASRPTVTIRPELFRGVGGTPSVS